MFFQKVDFVRMFCWCFRIECMPCLESFLSKLLSRLAVLSVTIFIKTGMNVRRIHKILNYSLEIDPEEEEAAPELAEPEVVEDDTRMEEID